MKMNVSILKVKYGTVQISDLCRFAKTSLFSIRNGYGWYRLPHCRCLIKRLGTNSASVFDCSRSSWIFQNGCVIHCNQSHIIYILCNLQCLYIPEKYNLRNMVSIKSYSYNKLVLAYGPNQGATVTVQWSTNDKAFKLVFGRSKFQRWYPILNASSARIV